MPLPDTTSIPDQPDDADRITALLAIDFDNDRDTEDIGPALGAAFEDYLSALSEIDGFRAVHFVSRNTDVTVSDTSGTYPEPE
jgi:hypothetical protein